MHVTDVPLVRLFRAETAVALDAANQRVWNEVVSATHVVRKQRKVLERHVAARSRAPVTKLVFNHNFCNNLCII